MPPTTVKQTATTARTAAAPCGVALVPSACTMLCMHDACLLYIPLPLPSPRYTSPPPLPPLSPSPSPSPPRPQVISKKKLHTQRSRVNMRREVQILHHLAGHSNIVNLK